MCPGPGGAGGWTRPGLADVMARLGGALPALPLRPAESLLPGLAAGMLGGVRSEFLSPAQLIPTRSGRAECPSWRGWWWGGRVWDSTRPEPNFWEETRKKK